MARNFLRDSFFGKALLRSSNLSKILLRGCGGKILVGAVCLLAAVCLQAPVALAQHGGGAHMSMGGGHMGGGHVSGGHMGGGHVGSPRSSVAPSGSHGGKGGSFFHFFHHTKAGAPKAGATSASTAATAVPATPASNSFLMHPIVGRSGPAPIPTPQPVFFVPVYFGSPFFYGGFNSFGWGCGGFWGAGCLYSPSYGFGLGYGWGGYGGYSGGYSGGWGGGYAGLSTGGGVYSSSNASDLSTIPVRTEQSEVPAAHRNDLVELFFKDGMVYDVTDYWVVEGQLHFLTVDESGQKTVEHVVPFDTLDLQTTRDDNTSRGFKFELRNQSMEQYFREHPESVPKAVDPDAPQN